MTTEQKVTRKLRAILSADVKGYSLLMTNDEAVTIKTLKKYRSIMSELIKQHSGRVVDAPGDNLLAEFPSAVNAVQCSVEIQNALETKNADLPVDKRLVFRIGVNIGDVVQDGDSLYGDGVNIAARIEGLADPGGVCISRNAYDHIHNKLNFGYEYLGGHSVKNIKNPVRVYKILMEPEDAGKLIGEKPKPALKSWVWFSIVVAAIVLTLIGYQLFQKMTAPEFKPASIEKMVFPLPEKPSIAVLPFVNMSGDPKQEYFSDGFTEHIITSLSKVPYIFVIARNSTFAYKGKAAKINQIAEELGVRYVLEGSIQRSDDNLRITVQLIDAITGLHLWAENYDRKLKDIFALQDEIAMKIMAGLQVKIGYESHGRFATIRTTNLKAYEKVLKGSEHFLRRTEGDTLQARILAKEAIAMDPEYGAAYNLLGWTHLDDIWFYRTKDRTKSLQIAEQLAHKAIDLAGQAPTPYRLLSNVFMLRKQYEKAIVEVQKAVELSPNSASSIFIYGLVLRYAGRFDEAIPFLRKAIRLNPVKPVNYLNNLAWSYALSEQYEKAIPLWNQAIERNPDYLFAYSGLTCTYQLLGNEIKAREAAAEVLRIEPTYSTAKIGEFDIINPELKKRILEAYHKAGIPE